ncbi:O-antigen ligase family protein [Nocardioides euryhalodurans]|uniref:O-antigen ligase domain-containing protein n=1 Tax=Nocardioides euryhalodurans TaxID=2518370 RepID=A0A4P7GLB5_9ACTN|nr:O-antigen ligase family protein [Nocardioides euryhalodurans]QBR92723.1 O-antigen ligase domain-containing protein [Nocardioides euryhalodurans]
MTAYVLLAAVAWAVATRGGTGPRDLALVLVLLALAVVTARARPPRHVSLGVTMVALLLWLLVAGPLRTGLTLEGVRVPLLVVGVVLTVLATRRLDHAEREVFLGGMVVLGCLHAVVALGELAVAVSQRLPYPARVDSLLGSSNGLAMLLVATSVLTVREIAHRGGRLPALALLVQGAAVIATGSRTAIALAAVLLVGYAASRPGWRPRAVATCGVLAGGAMVAWRFATEPPEPRPHLWREALARIADHPLMGAGPEPAEFSLSAADARATTHAHDELLQWGVEYGLVGVGLALLVLVLAVRTTRPYGQGDRWALLAATILLSAGLVDFTLRITALAVVAAALATLGLTDPPPPRAAAPPASRATSRDTRVRPA